MFFEWRCKFKTSKQIFKQAYNESSRGVLEVESVVCIQLKVSLSLSRWIDSACGMYIQYLWTCFVHTIGLRYSPCR